VRIAASVLTAILTLGAHQEVPRAERDVVIVGAGIAGLSAALEAANGGASVLVVDMWSIFGGHAVLSHGGLCIVGTPVQEAKGIEDSPALAEKDFHDWGEDADAEWVRYYVHNSREQIYDWLTAKGVRFSGVQKIPGNSVARFHEPIGRGMTVVSSVYRDAVSHPGIELVWNFEVDGLLVENGRVVGVEGKHLRGGERDSFRGRAVVLATGGFQSNLEMVREYWPENMRFPEGILAGSGLNSLGSGHRVAEKAGAAFHNMDHQWNYATGLPDPRYPGAYRGLNASNNASIWVNAQGKRFVNEISSVKTEFSALLAQEPARYWAVFDEKSKRQFAITGSDWADFQVVEEVIFRNPEVMKSAPTLEGLAKAAGLPENDLVETVARYNQAVTNKKDSDFGRTVLPATIDTPPYYAATFFPLARKSMGGVLIDAATRVLDKQGKPIEGLYAAGEVAGFGGINGKAGLEGTFLGPSIVTGRVAGRTILKSLGERASSPAAPQPTAVTPPPQGFESETCLTCHDVAALVAEPRPGYSHFEKAHRVVLEKGTACSSCHAEMFPIDLDRHRIDRLRQIDTCQNCHQATEM
jgi:flavocytochrome c